MNAKKLEVEFEEAINEAKKDSISDWLPIGFSYFWCGGLDEKYYNHSFAMAIEIIGKLYGDKNHKKSNYQKGIAYIAKELDITKTQVKSLRKTMTIRNRNSFKTPYMIPQIVNKIITLLKNGENSDEVKLFIEKCQGELLYRSMIISKQYETIVVAAKNGRQKVKDIAKQLNAMTISVNAMTISKKGINDYD